MILVAHRMPPTEAGIHALAEAGANVFEWDVQLTRHGLVVSHFLPFSRHLRSLRHDRHRLSWSPLPPGPRLEDAIARRPPGARISLDLKADDDAGAGELARQVLRLGLDPADYIVCSKNWDSLSLLHDHGFEIWMSIADRRALTRYLRADGWRSHGVTIRHSYLTAETFAELARRGTVVGWTVNDVARASTLAGMGITGITTDNPAVLAALNGDGG